MSTQIHYYAARNDLKIVEAKEPMLLEVIGSDIRNARKKDAKACAFACSVKRARPEIKEAFFFRTIAYLETNDGQLVRYQLPPSVQKEIVSFDRSQVMEPGNYHIQVPPKSGTLRAAKKRRPKGIKRKRDSETGIKRRLVHQTQNVRKFGQPL